MIPRTREMNRTLAALRKLTVDGVPPTYDQVARELGIVSRSGVHARLTALREAGLVRWEPSRQGSLRITDDPWSDLAKLSTSDLKALSVRIDVLIEERARA